MKLSPNSHRHIHNYVLEILTAFASLQSTLSKKLRKQKNYEIELGTFFVSQFFSHIPLIFNCFFKNSILEGGNPPKNIDARARGTIFDTLFSGLSLKIDCYETFLLFPENVDFFFSFLTTCTINGLKRKMKQNFTEKVPVIFAGLHALERPEYS